MTESSLYKKKKKGDEFDCVISSCFFEEITTRNDGYVNALSSWARKALKKQFSLFSF